MMRKVSLRRAVHAAENAFTPALLILITLILAITIVARVLGFPTLRASNDYIRYLVLWISFAGAMITTREKSHLSLSIGIDRIPEKARLWVTTGTSFVSTAICTVQAGSALSFVLSGFRPVAERRIHPHPDRGAHHAHRLRLHDAQVRADTCPGKRPKVDCPAGRACRPGHRVDTPGECRTGASARRVACRGMAFHGRTGIRGRGRPGPLRPVPAPHHRADRERLPGRTHLCPGRRPGAAVLLPRGRRPGNRGQPGLHDDHGGRHSLDPPVHPGRLYHLGEQIR